ncbi:MAG: 1,5-anhydro-D-fructose reductase [Alphaproteobacteria bacterium MarineAlpha9_Bin5]|nr:MAG: 1,5-anhydro-D-fructose reductase [Alphaproteobacteria bacterium MarineAlpha9_Bin5]HIB17638.1 Gfo/Idh/MocA family oxidoreductase [Alphaproteobacteria bacterium]HIB57008.1 Gfo/Idh/MocA family oxidoreductase [Alphaproteobacteria bacterium]HIO03187.1 Gfo/Idh/MocA family oxidoreductase [Alphaproteobacteria bacterium]
MKPVRWGVLSTAKIGRERVIPAMQQSPLCDIHAIASRDPMKARRTANELGIEKSYGSYEELLADPEIEAIYNPLPNHLHVPWSIKAAQTRKHVLCEKPIAMTATEAGELVAARDSYGVLIEEAFMPRHHPQWKRVRSLLRNGTIGEARAVQAVFSYHNINPDDVRNQAEIGGGGLYDIGSYCITLTRYAFEAAPKRVSALIDRDPTFGTDRLTGAIMDFGNGRLASFVCSTQMARHQSLLILGTKSWIRVNCPFAMPPDWRPQIEIGVNVSPPATVGETEEFEPTEQYMLQGEDFSNRLRTGTVSEFPLEDAVENMEVIDAIFRAAKSHSWETVC